ncbi:hypothetical protein M0R45_013055 [Rubus argutus]|uniref:non-specific serine/threonine protein kinase n=1 Tax=Rubus argutus TaxID=59490 RepID=A0AAW1XI54_RUBAR
MFVKALLLFSFLSFATSRDTIRWNEEQLKDVDGDYLVSKQSKFQLGFFSPGNSSHRYVGIWYSQSKVSAKTVVWVANRNNPINDTSGVLTINRYGELVLYAHNMETTPIWFPNMSQSVQNVNTSTLSAQLLDTGNFVVFQDDKSEIFIWQSFDYPTDTLLPENGSGGCVSKRVGVSKCGNGDGFVKVARVKYPDTSIAAKSRTGMSAKECEQECLSNCSCTAYLSLENEGFADCLTWYGDLMDILVYAASGRDLYVRVNETELAANAGKSQGFLERRGMLAIPILSALLAALLIIMLACWWLKKRRNIKDFVEVDELEETKRHPELQFFDLNTLIKATDNFSNVNELGQGGFGSVYKGQLPNAQKVAVKRLSRTSGQGTEEFKNEVALIARLQHRNLVKLLGCCIKGEERMLVLEYMPNKSLDSFLFDYTRRSLLDWKKRFEIINGIARGMLYLHQDSRLRIIHRDLKTSNVLLDAEMNPKIFDFGMARIFHGDQVLDKTNRVVGTYGYMSPEYVVFGRYSTKSDVFSFGIILLEIVTGKRNNGSYQEDPSVNLIGHVWELWREARALEIVDSTLESYHSDEVMRCIEVALLCVQEESKYRPAMSAVVFMLSGEVTSPSPPKQPAYVFRRNSETDANPLIPKVSTNDLTITAVEAR